MASTTPFVSQPQLGLFNHSSVRDVVDGTYISAAGDSHINNFVNPSTNPLARLHDFIAASAMHDSEERFPQPICYPSTRKKILERILNWVECDSCERIFWLYGSAGTGKSAIAQTVSECCKRNGRLAATFFFSRTSSKRNTNERLVATLAYQIALFVPGAKEFIANAVEDDLSVFSKDMNSQLLQLIIQPLTLAAQGWASTQQILIVIDGLDECVDKIQQTDILSVICNALMTHDKLPLRFLICSLPEHDIRVRFEQSDLQSATARLFVDIDDTVTEDITTLLEAEFSRIHRKHCIQETPWPPEGVIQSLAENASGQFIYPSTIIKFIDDQDFQPQQRLDMVLGTLPHGMCSPFAEIDILYTQILDAVPAFKVEKALLLLGIIIYHVHYHHLSFYDIPITDSVFLNELLQLNSGGIEHLLRELHSVLDVQSRVSVRHKSFPDFLSCKTRSGRYSINKEMVWAEVLGLLWATIPRRLKQLHNAPPRDLKRMLWTPYYSSLLAMIRHWRVLLPESRHAAATLEELAKIAIFLEKKASDTPQSKTILILGPEFSDFCPTIISWLSKEKLYEEKPSLWKQYISLFDEDILLFLKQVEFLDPIHSIHFLTFKISWRRFPNVSCVGMPRHIEVFLNFFLDPIRSGEYHLSAQHHADIVVWMIQYYYPLPKDIFVRRFQSGRANIQSPLATLLSGQSGEELRNQTVVMPIDIHLSRASRCAEQLIEIIRLYNPDTFPLMALSRPGGIEKTKTLKLHEKHREKVMKEIARYLLDNSQMYEQWEEDRKIRSSLTVKQTAFRGTLTHQLGTVLGLLHVVCSLLILAVSTGILLFSGSP